MFTKGNEHELCSLSQGFIMLETAHVFQVCSLINSADKEWKCSNCSMENYLDGWKELSALLSIREVSQVLQRSTDSWDTTRNIPVSDLILRCGGITLLMLHNLPRLKEFHGANGL